MSIRRERPRVAALSIAAWIAAVLLTSGAATAQTITRFTLPAGYGGAQSLVAGPDGALWFTETYGTRDGEIVQPSAIGRVTTSGAFAQFPLPTPSSLPGSIILAPDGNLWLTEIVCPTAFDCSRASARICRITAAGVITEFASPPASNLTVGPDGNFWFLQFDESDGPFSETPPHKIGRMKLDGTVLPEFEVGGKLGGLAAGPDGAVWFTDSGSPPRRLPGLPPRPCVNSKVGRVTTYGDVAEFDLPNCDGQDLRGITAGRDGNLWFTEGTGPGIGRIDPASHVITEFPISHDIRPDPVSIIEGPDGNIWFTEGGSQRIGRITPTGGLTEFPAAVLVGDVAAGPDGAVWFVEGEDNRIGRIATGATASCISDPHSLCLSGARFRVRATYSNHSSTDPRAATAVSLSGSSGFFTFENPESVELAVKVLDACDLTRRIWVFAAGLTNQGVTLTVTDTTTDVTRTYSNPLGNTFVTVTDTSAFSTCP